MKNLLGIILLLSFFISSTLGAKTIKIAITSDMPPYTFLDDKNNAAGIVTDYWKLWAKKTQSNIEFIPYTWEKSIDAVKNKEVDIHSGLIKSKKRAMSIHYLDSFLQVSSKIYVYNKKIEKIKDLENKYIAVRKGSFYEDYIKKTFPKIKIITYLSTRDLKKSILNETTDAIIEDSLIMSSNFEEYLSNKKISELGSFKMNNWIYSAISKDKQNFASFVLKGMRQITNADIKKIEEKWIKNKKLQKIKKKSNFDVLNKEEKKYIKNNPSIQIASVSAWNNISSYNEEGVFVGFHVDLIKQMNLNLNINLKLKTFTSWPKAYLSAKEGKTDAILGLSWTKKREDFFLYSSAYRYLPTLLIVRKKDNSIKIIKEFENKKVVTTKKSITKSLIKRISPKTKIVYVKNKSSILSALKNKKADFAFMPAISTAELNKYNLKIEKSLYFKEGKLYIGSNIKNALSHSIINKALNSISKEQMNEIESRWFKKKNKKSIFSKEELEYLRTSPSLVIGVESLAPIVFSKDQKTMSGIIGDIFKK